MTTTTTDRAEVFSRPAAQINEEGELVVRASAALGCRRSLWYSATGYQPTNPPGDDSLTAMEAGNALEPVVVRAMERAGWKVAAADPQDPQQVAVRIGPGLLVTGHPDATGRIPLPEDEAAAEVQMLLFGDAAQAPAYGDEMLVEIKTRGPEAFRRWQTLGAERSHPQAVAQAAFYTLGVFNDQRDAAIATMDTGNRTWDYEVVPAQQGRDGPSGRPAHGWRELGEHHALRNGPDAGRPAGAGLLRRLAGSAGAAPSSTACLPGAAAVDAARRGHGDRGR